MLSKCSREGRQEMLGADAREGRNAERAGPILQQRVIGCGAGHLCTVHAGHMGLYSATVHLTRARRRISAAVLAECSPAQRNPPFAMEMRPMTAITLDQA